MSQPIVNQSALGVLAENELHQALIVIGSTAPSDGAAGYAGGCLFIRTTGNGVGSSLYVNEGSVTSADFNAK